MPPTKLSMIKDLNVSTDRWRVYVRVIRRWNVYQKENPKEIFCISMLLVDAEGYRIQASILNKGSFCMFDDLLAEGKVYFMANFGVSENNKEYRATNHPFKLTIGSQTFITESSVSIPEYSYMFFPIADIVELKEMKTPVDYLIDVIGFVTSVGCLEDYRSGNEIKNKIRLTIADEMGISVSCVLYDECALTVCMHDFVRMEAPVVILIQLCRVGFTEDGTPEICSSFNATKVSFNLMFPEVKEFIESAKTIPSPTISTMSSCPGTQPSNVSAITLTRSHPVINIVEIPEKHGDDYFLIECVVIKVDTKHGWYYDGCARCGSKVKVVGGKTTCIGNMCKGKEFVVEPKMKVHYIVEDVSGKASVVFFEKLVVQFVGKSGAELKQQLEREERGYDFPDELDNLVGKRLLLKLKLNKYNKEYPNSAISVASYTEMADLLNDFDQAAHPEVDVVEQGIDDVTVGTQNAKGTTDVDIQNLIAPATDQEVSGLEDMPICSLISEGATKAKRKSYGKKSAALKEKLVDIGSGSPVKTYVKPLKFIKQEKN